MQRQRPGHRILSFHHRGLLLLVAAVAVMLFFLYGCMAGAVYSRMALTASEHSS